MSITVRNPSMDDVAAATEVLNEHSRRLHGIDDITVEELDETWRAPEVEFPYDVLLAEADSKLVGYADVIPWGETSWLDVRATEPAAYELLLEAAVRRAESHAKRHVRATANEKDAHAHQTFERADFHPFRHSFRMMIDLDGELPEPSWPEGFQVRPLREGDEPRFHAAHMTSFADTWEFTPEPFEQWAHWFLGHSFQPEHWFLVEHEGEVAAYAICKVSETEPDMGFVNLIGVLPAYRRRGLAIALLQHVFRHFAARGMKRVGLGVDAENPTGALRLYEHAGMHVARTTVIFEKRG